MCSKSITHVINKHHVCYRIIVNIASLIATFKHHALVFILNLLRRYVDISLLFFRENLCKYDAQHQSVDSHTTLPLPLHQPHPNQEDIAADAEHVEDVEVNTTITDKIIDAQNSNIHSKYVDLQFTVCGI